MSPFRGSAEVIFSSQPPKKTAKKEEKAPHVHPPTYMGKETDSPSPNDRTLKTTF